MISFEKMLYFLKGEFMPTIVTAANSAYFKPLEATVFYVHKFFPHAKLIIYDIGLTMEQYHSVIALHCTLFS